ncbi:MAG TPA: cyclic nucleotide-binding domain-containing protein [Anaerolineales bacterium]|nr:cyclic nucleotide-binding domain-containing protein [Anaerolineales bacterium]
MPSFFGIWDTEDHLGRTDKLLIISTGHNRRPIVSVLSVGRSASGRSLAKYRMNQKVFTQGSSADAVFYIQNGKVKITVTSEQGKEAR